MLRLDVCLQGAGALRGMGKTGEMREMKKTTRDNDEMDIMGNMVRRTRSSLCAKRRALRREAERVLRSNLGIPHSHTLDRNKVRMDDKARAAWSAYDRAIEGME